MEEWTWPRPSLDTTKEARRCMIHKDYRPGYYFFLYVTAKRVNICYAGYNLEFIEYEDFVSCNKLPSELLPQPQLEALKREAHMLMVATERTWAKKKSGINNQPKQTNSFEKIASEVRKKKKQFNLFDEET